MFIYCMCIAYMYLVEHLDPRNVDTSIKWTPCFGAWLKRFYVWITLYSFSNEGERGSKWGGNGRREGERREGWLRGGGRGREGRRLCSSPEEHNLPSVASTPASCRSSAKDWSWLHEEMNLILTLSLSPLSVAIPHSGLSSECLPQHPASTSDGRKMENLCLQPPLTQDRGYQGYSTICIYSHNSNSHWVEYIKVPIFSPAGYQIHV